MTPRLSLDIEQLRTFVEYDPNTGFFHWKPRYDGDPANESFNTKFAGKRAGNFTKSNRYGRINIRGQLYQAHRMAWAYYHGFWPPQEIDHVNGDPHDNRIANLRLATRNENLRNAKKSCRNTSGFKGVTFHKRLNLWCANIIINKKKVYLGAHASREKAGEAYRIAAMRHFGEFARFE